MRVPALRLFPRLFRASWLAGVWSLIPLVALIGCTRLQVWMGWRVRLEKIPIVAMQASLPKGQGMVPGEKSPLVVSLSGPDGQVFVTEGEGRGKVLWEDLQVTASVVSVNAKGVVSLPADPRISDGKVPHLAITVPSHPDLRAEMDLPLRYDAPFMADFRADRVAPA